MRDVVISCNLTPLIIGARSLILSRLLEVSVCVCVSTVVSVVAGVFRRIMSVWRRRICIPGGGEDDRDRFDPRGPRGAAAVLRK